MILSIIGKMAYQYWQEIPNHFPFVQLDQFVVMPNHVYGIIVINNHDGKTNNPAGSCDVVETGDTVETQDLASLPTKTTGIPTKTIETPTNTTETKNKFGPQSRNAGSIIRGFKIGVTKETKKDKIPFGWQPRFYDHIIRDNQDLWRIRKYIQYNPCNWKNDDFYAI